MSSEVAIDENELVGRIHARDASLWGPPGTPEVADRLGWLDLPMRILADVTEARGEQFGSSDTHRHAGYLDGGQRTFG